MNRHLYYIDYFRNDISCGNIGCLRITEQKDGFLLSVRISGLPRTTNTVCQFSIQSALSSPLTESFPIVAGCGSFEKKMSASHLLDVTEYRFAFGQARYGRIKLQNRSSEQAEKNLLTAASPIEKNLSSTQSALSDISVQQADAVEAKNLSLQAGITDAKKLSLQADSKTFANSNLPTSTPIHQSSTIDDSDAAEFSLPTDSATNEEPIYDPLIERWAHFRSSFPVVHPFENQGEFVMIDPDSIRMLSAEDHKLMHNSFLLHAYYNYRHILLGPYKEKETTDFYIGVPGTFQKREQMAADMFGFEGYEHAGESGYYLRRVSLLPIPEMN